MEISESTKFVFYVSRVFGLSPYTIVKKNEKYYTYSKSLWFSIYSALLITVVVLFTIRGIFYADGSNDGSSARNIHKTNSPTAKFVTFMDVTIVVSFSVSGFLCGIAGLKYTQELNHRLMKVDANIALYFQKVNETKDKRQSILLFLLVAFITLLTIGLDLWAWHRNSRKAANPLDDKIIAYTPFYVLYLIGSTLLIIFSGTVLGIYRRFKHINEILRQLHKNAHFKMLSGNGRKTPIIQIHLAPSDSLTSINQSEDLFGPTVDNNNLKMSSVVKVMTGDEESINYDLLLRRIAYSHSSLSKAVVLVSKTFGLALLAILASCLLQLVGTSYYFLNEIVGKKDAFSTFLQLLWLFVHLFRLLLTIEPCHITNEEARKTVIIVCDLMRNVRDPCLKETLRIFWSQLIAHDVVFSACGMCKITRKILTSFCASIATYLIILMQFQKSNG